MRKLAALALLGMGAAAFAQEKPKELAVESYFGNQPFTLADLQGRVIMLDFWATW